MVSFFFFNDTATTEIYTLSLHDALPISDGHVWPVQVSAVERGRWTAGIAELHSRAASGWSGGGVRKVRPLPVDAGRCRPIGHRKRRGVGGSPAPRSRPNRGRSPGGHGSAWAPPRCRRGVGGR